MKRLKLFFIFLFVISGLKGFSQNDSLVNFWKTVNPLSYISGFVPKDTNLSKVPGSFFLLKNDFDGWLLIGNGSGIVCKLNNSFQWERLDNTVFSGYNFGAFPFISSGNVIYKYGGYGFWQTNGLLIFYDRHRKEWEFTSLNVDLKNVGCYGYFDKQSQKLYQFGSLDFNQTLWNPLSYSDSIFELDLQSKKWNASGKINNEIKKFNVLNAFMPNGHLQPFPNGFIYLNDDGQSFAVDFIREKFILFNQAVNDSLKSYLFDQRQGKLLVSQQNGLTVFDQESLREIKSVEWVAILNGITELPLLQPVSNSLTSPPFFKIIGVAILLILLLLFIYNKRRAFKLFKPSFAQIETASLDEKIVMKTDGSDCVINGKKASEFLNDLELSCLSFITVGMKENNLVNTVQLNDHLKIDSKTPDYQKKTRSDLIKSINYKVRANTKFSTGDLVKRRQSEIDKRMVIYEISSDVRLETPTSAPVL